MCSCPFVPFSLKVHEGRSVMRNILTMSSGNFSNLSSLGISSCSCGFCAIGKSLLCGFLCFAERWEVFWVVFFVIVSHVLRTRGSILSRRIHNLKHRNRLVKFFLSPTAPQRLVLHLPL